MTTSYFKYRKFDTDNFSLNGLKDDTIYASDLINLNDPYEGFINDELVKLESNIFKNISNNSESFKGSQKELEAFLDRIKITGVFSISKNWNNELMWAHYADNYKGFCIEYDLTKIEKFHTPFIYLLMVNYRKRLQKPSQIEFIKDDLRIIINTFLGQKSRAWKYENEKRLIFDKYGEKAYDSKALISVTLGTAINKTNKQNILKILQTKNVDVYELIISKNCYVLQRNLIHKFRNPNSNMIEINIDKHFFTENWLGIFYNQKHLLKKAISYLEKNPNLIEIVECGFMDESSAQNPIVYFDCKFKNTNPQFLRIKYSRNEIETI